MVLAAFLQDQDQELGAPAADAYQSQSDGILGMLKGLEEKFKKEDKKETKVPSLKIRAASLSMRRMRCRSTPKKLGGCAADKRRPTQRYQIIRIGSAFRLQKPKRSDRQFDCSYVELIVSRNTTNISTKKQEKKEHLGSIRHHGSQTSLKSSPCRSLNRSSVLRGSGVQTKRLQGNIYKTLENFRANAGTILASTGRAGKHCRNRKETIAELASSLRVLTSLPNRTTCSSLGDSNSLVYSLLQSQRL